MTDIEIETLLRKAPRSAVPAGLLQNLIAEISLPEAEQPRRNHFEPGMFFRRWLPAISFAAFLLACAVVVGVQTNWIAQLRQENKTLRVAASNLEQLRSDNAEYQRLLTANQELERLRKDALEIPKLRAEIGQLRVQMQELQNLRTENQRLVAASKAAQKAVEEEDPFAQAKKKAEAIQCINNLKQIQLGALMWAGDNKNDTLPTDFLLLKEYLGTPVVFKCPGDDKRTAAASWSDFNAANNSYRLLSPGVSMTNTPSETVFSYCPIHNSAGFLDGHVELLGKNSRIVTKDGVTKVERSNEIQK